jgi:hypothetical protein
MTAPMTSREALLPCPLCTSTSLCQFTHSSFCDDGWRNVDKIMCADCQCEAPLAAWNARAGAAQNSGWQPIETAPLDCSIIVATDEDVVGEAHFEGPNWYWAGGDSSDYHDTQCRYPRHWQPLPTGPSVPSTTQGVPDGDPDIADGEWPNVDCDGEPVSSKHGASE